MRRRILDSVLELTVGDLVQQETDAIVNAANSRLLVGGGVDGAIHRAAGPTVIEEIRDLFPEGCPTGQAVATGAGKLHAKWIFHAVGPAWTGGRQDEPALLQSAIRSSLELALEKGCDSIAFPAISTGIFGYPMDRAAHDSLSAAIDFLHENAAPQLVRFVLAGAGAYGAFSRALDELAPE